MVNDAVSLYWHIPFCNRKCPYCHFYVIPNQPEHHKQLFKGLRLEWERILPLLEGKRIVSIYFGGGTPSLIGADALGEILSWIPYHRHETEVTLEANPEDVTYTLMENYRQVGVNRISMGVQSFDPSLLQRLCRTHSHEQAYTAVLKTAEAGITNISIDLMYDLPSQTLESWKHTIEQALSLPITHLSLYNLTLEPRTPFYKQQNALRREMPDDATSTQMLLYAMDNLNRAGFKQYEISAFSQEGAQSEHNRGYWTARPFLGLGPSAFSYWEQRRFRNHAHLGKYLNALQQGRSPVDFRELLSPEKQLRERLAVQLRLLEGIHTSQIPLDKETLQTLKQLQIEGFLKIEKDHITLTRQGMLFYDTVASEII